MRQCSEQKFPLLPGFSPHPSSQPSSPESELCLSYPGVAVILKNQEPPLHLPHGYGGGDKKPRQANQKPHVEYWRELLGYIDAAYRQKFGRHYPWNNLVRKNLWNLARAYSSGEVMALWDLYLANETWWARQTGWSVYGMIRDTGRLMDDSRLKPMAARYVNKLIKKSYGTVSAPSTVFKAFFPSSACELHKSTTESAPSEQRTISE